MAKSRIFVIFKSLVISYIATAILLLILSFLLFQLELDEDKVSIGIIVIYLLSCFLGGFLAGKKCGNRKFLWGMMIGLGYFLLLMIMSMFVRQEVQGQSFQIFTTCLLCMGGGMFGGMLS